MMKSFSDTDSRVEKLQIDLMRRAGTAQKISCMRALSSTVMQLSYRAISRAHPELSEQELDLFFVGLHYGKGLSSRFRAYLEKNRR